MAIEDGRRREHYSVGVGWPDLEQGWRQVGRYPQRRDWSEFRHVGFPAEGDERDIADGDDSQIPSGHASIARARQSDGARERNVSPSCVNSRDPHL